MNIEDKLELVKDSQVIVGIKEGMFVRFYEQSLFGWQQWASTQPHLPTLKVLVKKVKKLDNQEIGFYRKISGHRLGFTQFPLTTQNPDV